jgi:hypothetical protein
MMMDSMANELKLIAKWEADRKKLKAQHIKSLADLDARWGRTMAGYENQIKGNPDLEKLIKL